MIKKDILYVYNTDTNPICRDAGKLYADSLNFKSKVYTELVLSDYIDYQLIIDLGWATDNYASWLENTFSESDNGVLFRIVDDNVGSYSNAQLRIMRLFYQNPDLGNRLISPYQSKYFDRYYPYFIPYHYSEDDIVDNSNRLDFAVLSGYNDRYYTMRSDLYAADFDNVIVIIHPGYSGRCWENRVGLDYIKSLSTYKVMLVTTSYNEYELLKYVECAEAGCAPLGEFPPSLLRELTPNLKYLHCDNIYQVKEKLPHVLEEYKRYADEYRLIISKIRSKLEIIKKYDLLINTINSEL